MASRADHQPGPSWIPALAVEDRDLAPADAKAHKSMAGATASRTCNAASMAAPTVGWCRSEPSLTVKAGGSMVAVDAQVVQRRCEPAVQSGAVRGASRSHDVTDQCRANEAPASFESHKDNSFIIMKVSFNSFIAPERSSMLARR